MKEEESTAIPIEDEDDPSSTLLDLTSYQLHDLDLVELPPSLTANRLSLLDPHIGNLSHLKKLSHCENLAVASPLFPQNIVSSLEQFDDVVSLCRSDFAEVLDVYERGDGLY
ncbi:Protein phosphatase 1 regulatory inhibitor subunit PPP1R7 [Glycine max]|nr:Protein phosphatase 1 regulatory inhibitor subunit PPP1R7 [Glycine max]